MRRLRRCYWFVAFTLLAGPWISAAAHAEEAKNRFENERIAFEVQVLPEDPFDGAYQANGKPSPFKARRGQTVKVVVTGTPTLGFHTYPLVFKGPEQKDYVSKLTLGVVKDLVPLQPIQESQPELMDGKYEHTQTFTWSQDVAVLPSANPGRLVLPISIATQVCDDKNCLPVYPKLEVVVDVSAEKESALTPELAKRIAESGGGASKPGDVKKPTPVETRPAETKSDYAESSIKISHEEYKSQMLDKLAKRMVNNISVQAQEMDLLGFLLAGVFWGAVSLITPCVFPMIPITVSFFLKQSEKEHHRPIHMAVVYSATIVVVLTLAAALLLETFRFISISPILNFALGGLFIFFALSLFGMYEIELPSGLARFTSAREGQGGTVGTIFMALTFTIISFACVAPFLGGFGGTAADEGRPLWQNLLGGLAFSLTFAAPFFILALFPTMLRKLPKSGSWLNSVKVVMGFLEFAAAFKFFRQAELVQSSTTSLFTFDLCLGIWIALCFLCGLYLLGLYRLPHDTPEEHLGVPRMLFSGLFLALGFYLMPALFKVNSEGEPQRPRGAVYAWVDSFLLPDTRPGGHTGNLDWAVAQAREQRKKTGQPKRVFIDFTGKS